MADYQLQKVKQLLVVWNILSCSQGATPLHLCSYTDGKKPMRSLEKTAPEDLAVFQRIRLWPFKEIERADLAAFLLKHGADPSIKNHQVCT